jgi:hypothetical protein
MSEIHDVERCLIGNLVILNSQYFSHNKSVPLRGIGPRSRSWKDYILTDRLEGIFGLLTQGGTVTNIPSIKCNKTKLN